MEQSNPKKYKYISIEDKVQDVMNHPAFKGFGFYLFPWNDKNRYSKNMTMKEVIIKSLAYKFKRQRRSSRFKSSNRRYKQRLQSFL